MAYTNELWGGPSQTFKYRSDSNVDWGPQLKSTKTYLERKGIQECWFIYFAQGPVRTKDYGIPCKPLVTMGTLWLDEELDVPPGVDGPVLISAGTLSGFEFGPGPLNPYEVFKHQQPTDVIDYGVFVSTDTSRFHWLRRTAMRKKRSFFCERSVRKRRWRRRSRHSLWLPMPSSRMFS